MQKLEYRPPDTAEVFIGIPIPTGARKDWSLKRYYDCPCGFEVGKHPVCIICGLAIGPYHLMKYGSFREVSVYTDTFNEQYGYWEVSLFKEVRPVCYACLLYESVEPLRIPPIRRHSREMNRVSKVNAWRRRRNLPLIRGTNGLYSVESTDDNRYATTKTHR